MSVVTQPAPVKTPVVKVKDSIGKAHWSVKAAVVVLCVAWLVPALGVILTSFRTKDDAATSGWWNVLVNPSHMGRLSLQNYHDVITQGQLGSAFVNSLAIALPSTFIPILVAAFAAYAFSFMSFPGRNVLFITIVSLLVVPNFVAFVPVQKLYIAVDPQGQFLRGNFMGVWLAHVGFGMSLAIYLLRNYMASLPKEVIESAKVDGASHFTTFFRLVLPMSTPALASFAIFQFLWVWNDLLVALVFLGPGDNAPLTVAVQNQLGTWGQNWSQVTAGGLMTMILPVIVFLSLQRYFVRGLTAGSVKG